MFQIRHFYHRLICANKVSSKASFSNWQNFGGNWHNSSAIFGGLILQIHGCRPNWNFKHQKRVHRNHFYTGNYDISSPIDDNTNYSWPISSMAETLTNIKQHEIRTEIPDIDELYARYISLNDSSRKVLNLKLIKGKNGHKFFIINFFDDYNKFELNFPKIPVPADAYAFVNKIDELMGEFADQKFQDNIKANAAGDDRKPKPIAELKRHIAVMAGLFHKFQLELYIFPYLNPKYKQQKQLCIVRLCALNLESNKLTMTNMFLPLEALLWLREQMANMLMRHDGAETIEREAPAKIPKQFRMNGLILTEAIE